MPGFGKRAPFPVSAPAELPAPFGGPDNLTRHARHTGPGRACRRELPDLSRLGVEECLSMQMGARRFLFATPQMIYTKIASCFWAGGF